VLTMPVEPCDVFTGLVVQAADKRPRRHFLFFLITQSI
jgi:hypothetical protein